MRGFNERFIAIAAQLGDAQPAVRLAGAHAMAGLAEDWAENRQTCVDVLCAYLRLPYDPDPGDDATPAKRAVYLANREVRHTVIRLIGAHLREGAVVSWEGLDFDFTGVIFDGGEFGNAVFSGGKVRLVGAVFSGGEISFYGAKFSGGEVDFYRAKFSGGTLTFDGAVFSSGKVGFIRAEFSSGRVSFERAEFSGGTVSFERAEFSGGTVDFGRAVFSGGTVSFGSAVFSGGTVDFGRAVFCGGTAKFGRGARFARSRVNFGGAVFSAGEVDFRGPVEWTRPQFDWDATSPPPAVVLLPGIDLTPRHVTSRAAQPPVGPSQPGSGEKEPTDAPASPRPVE